MDRVALSFDVIFSEKLRPSGSCIAVLLHCNCQQNAETTPCVASVDLPYVTALPLKKAEQKRYAFFKIK